MTSPMDDALRRTNEAVERYGVPQKLIGIAAFSLEQMPGDVRRTVEVNALVDAIVHAAGSHRGPHPDCIDCMALSNALAVSMGVVRAEADLELTAILGE